jgi:hypothetical protein
LASYEKEADFPVRSTLKHQPYLCKKSSAYVTRPSVFARIDFIDDIKNIWGQNRVIWFWYIPLGREGSNGLGGGLGISREGHSGLWCVYVGGREGIGALAEVCPALHEAYLGQRLAGRVERICKALP